MQLRRAKLCLDCDEIHEGPQCPACASETFAYLTRWVPAPERRTTPRLVALAPLAATATRLPSRSKVVGLGIVGLGIFGIAQWLKKGRRMIENSAMRNPGELK